jgi:hypothetical protein
LGKIIEEIYVVAEIVITWKAARKSWIRGIIVWSILCEQVACVENSSSLWSVVQKQWQHFCLLSIQSCNIFSHKIVIDHYSATYFDAFLPWCYTYLNFFLFF